MLYKLAQQLLFRLDAETAHRATIKALSKAPSKAVPIHDSRLRQDVAGLSFSSPVGLAAGFDKNAEAYRALLGLGFGFVEVGTLTPRSQWGNPRPRLFRLPKDKAVINRMGFNNDGQSAAADRLLDRKRKLGVVGINIGANKDSRDRIADYVLGIQSMTPLADYLTVNISSPNTPGLRQLQDEEALKSLLSAIREARGNTRVPVFLKVAPDLEADDPDRIARIAIDHGIDALIVANTTIGRPNTLRSPRKTEAGGLSGQPLAPIALDALRAFRKASGGEIPLIAAGGIASGDDAWQRIRAGASMVQLYTAMVYEGPGIAMKIAGELVDKLDAEGLTNIAEAVGTE